MGTLYIDTGGAATNSGTTDGNTATISGVGATVAGSVVTLPAGTDLSGVVTAAGPTQSAIYLNDATNANMKIFWATATADSGGAAPNITVSVAPTGVVASSWAVGGRYAAPAGNGLNLLDGALRAGDIVTINNSPATATVDWVTCRTAGTSAAGFIKLKGVTGTRPVVTVSNTTQCLDCADIALWWFENLECAQQGASGNACRALGNGTVAYNLKVSDAGAVGIEFPNNAGLCVASEVSGTGTIGISIAGSGTVVKANYIHDNTLVGIQNSGAATYTLLLQNIIDTCTGKGVNDSGAPTTSANRLILEGNTVYGCGDSGLEVADIDRQTLVTNNIFSENGNAAGEYNVEWLAGTAELIGFHGWNVFYHSGGGGGANLSGLTVNAQVASSEFTTDPGFTDAAGGNFAISSTSPAKASGYPGVFLGGSTGYLDIGAVQRQEAGGGGGQRVIGG